MEMLGATNDTEKEQSQRPHTSWFQSLIQNDTNQDSVVLA